MFGVSVSTGVGGGRSMRKIACMSAYECARGCVSACEPAEDVAWTWAYPQGCECVRVGVLARLRACVCAFAGVRVRVCGRACECACVRVGVHVGVRVGVRMGASARGRARACPQRQLSQRAEAPRVGDGLDGGEEVEVGEVVD
eukprot:6178321-Pleurochrysis_carterae.AAC.1